MRTRDIVAPAIKGNQSTAHEEGSLRATHGGIRAGAPVFSWVPNRATGIGVILVAFFVAAAVLIPVIYPWDPLTVRISEALQPPGVHHLMGTDQLGRDVFARVLYGIRVSLTVAALSVIVGGAIGITAGLVAGYFGGWVDRIVSSLVDIMLAFPSLLLAMAVVTILGPGERSVVVAVGIMGIPQYVRVLRAITKTLKNWEFVEAARAVGCTNVRILIRYILPNAISPIIVLSTVGMAVAILVASSLSYLGLGVQPPAAELGAMLAQGRTYLQSAWWLTVVPGIVLLFVIVGINMLGEGLRDALDPRLRRTWKS